MKLLTFAFVIQFIIACWPKIDIIISHYGKLGPSREFQ